MEPDTLPRVVELLERFAAPHAACRSFRARTTIMDTTTLLIIVLLILLLGGGFYGRGRWY
jgi:hypothetical protein